MLIITSETLQITPCQASPHGSPPEAVQPGSEGAPSAAYKPLIATTDSKSQTMLIKNSQKIIKEHTQISLRTQCLLTIVRVSGSKGEGRSQNQQRQEQRKKTVELRTTELCNRSLTSSIHCFDAS